MSLPQTSLVEVTAAEQEPRFGEGGIVLGLLLQAHGLGISAPAWCLLGLTGDAVLPDSLLGLLDRTGEVPSLLPSLQTEG